MKTRRTIVLFLIAGLIAAVLMFGQWGLNRLSAQGPTHPDPAVSEQVGVASAPAQVEQETLGPQAPDATTYYYHVRGADLYSVDSATDSKYVTGGCTYRSAGGTGLTFPVLVQPGSILKGIRVFYVDNDASNLTAYLVRYDDGGGALTLATATSSGASSSVRYMDSPTISHTVDLYNYSYALVFQPGVNNNLSQLCGIKVNYERGIFGTALPLITR